VNKNNTNTKQEQNTSTQITEIKGGISPVLQTAGRKGALGYSLAIVGAMEFGFVICSINFCPKLSKSVHTMSEL